MVGLHVILFSVVLIFFITKTVSLKCSPDACHTVRCGAPECGPGEERGKGGYCLCCDVCRKLIGEGEDCSSGSSIGGVISDKVTCSTGLICRENKCQKV